MAFRIFTRRITFTKKYNYNCNRECLCLSRGQLQYFDRTPPIHEVITIVVALQLRYILTLTIFYYRVDPGVRGRLGVLTCCSGASGGFDMWTTWPRAFGGPDSTASARAKHEVTLRLRLRLEQEVTSRLRLGQ